MSFATLLPILLSLLGRGSSSTPQIDGVIKTLIDLLMRQGQTPQTPANPIDIAKAQAALLLAGFDPGPIDGQFGAKTKAATLAYQQARGLVPDGLIGQQTYAKLMAESK